MSRRPEHLQARGGAYHFRLRVPEELQDLVGKTEIKKSLGKDYAKARKLLPLERLRAQSIIESAKAKLRARQAMAPRVVHDLGDDELWGLMTKWFVRREREAAGLSGREVDVEVHLEELAHLSDISEGTSALASVYGATRKLLAEENIELDTTASGFAKLQGLLHEAMLEHEKRIIGRFGNRSAILLNPRFSSLNENSFAERKATISLRALTEKYERERAITQKSPTARVRRNAHTNLILSILGESTLAHEVDRDRAKQFRAALEKWPANCTKRFRNLSASEILAFSEDRRAPFMKPPTANAYLETFCGLFEIAKKEGFIDGNPALGLRFRGGGHSIADREPFEIEDLQVIFAAPIFTGCLDDGEGYAARGSAKPRRSRFWIPLLALFSGLRLNEICQLQADDLEVIAGIPALVLRSAEGKHHKTKAAARVVPIHLELQKIGFLAYVADRRKEGPAVSLFPDLVPSSTGYLSNNFSKWFGRFLDSIGLPEEKKSFHSFRHSFRDAMSLGGVDPEAADRLGGWAVRTTSGKYGGSHFVQATRFAPQIAKVAYPGLNLAHLHQHPILEG